MLLRFVLVVSVLAASTAHAQPRYVTDRLSVELRRGPSTEYLIIRNVQAGEAVEVLEENAEVGYSRIRVGEQGAEGWILTRFLADEPSSRDKLSVAERDLAAARERLAELEQQVDTLTGQLGEASMQLQQTRADHGLVSAELSDIRTASANVVGMRDENASLRQRLTAREQDVDRLTIENAGLVNRERQNWFIVGAGVLFGGIVIGLVAPSLRRKRRSDW